MRWHLLVVMEEETTDESVKSLLLGLENNDTLLLPTLAGFVSTVLALLLCQDRIAPAVGHRIRQGVFLTSSSPMASGDTPKLN
jgi:hypothetical protein